MRCLAFTALFLSAFAPLAPASAQSANLCQSLNQCVDILERHPPNAFDYDLLAAEFTRFGAPAQTALVTRARNPELAPRIFDLAARPKASRSLRRALLDSWPVPDPALHLALAPNAQSPGLRRRAIATLNTPNAALRAASRQALATQSPDLSPSDAQAAFDALAQSATTEPSPAIIRLLMRVPNERGAAVIVRTLTANDADVIATAFLALESLNPTRARIDLEAAFTQSPPAFAPAWTQALETLGRESKSFDAIAFGYKILNTPGLSPTHRAVGLHSALLYPSGEKGDVGPSARALLPELTQLPLSSRLAATAPTHSLFANPQAVETLLPAIARQDTQDLARFITTLGKVGKANTAELLLTLFDRTPDYRVQIAVIGAVRPADLSRFSSRVTNHPIGAVRKAGSRRLRGVSKLDQSCFAGGDLFPRAPERLPYFQSGRVEEGRKPGRWELVDAEPLPGGWLAAYRTDLLRYSSNDTAQPLTNLKGRPLAVLPDTPLQTGQRASVFWIMSTDDDVTYLTRYADGEGLGTPSTLPPGARVITNRHGPSESHRAWALAFPKSAGQATLHLTRDARLQPLCAAPNTN